MRQCRKPCIVVYKLLKETSATKGSSDFQNTGKRASIGMGILYGSEYRAQIWQTLGVFLFIPLLDCDINLLTTFGMTLVHMHVWTYECASFIFVVKKNGRIISEVNGDCVSFWKEMSWPSSWYVISICLVCVAQSVRFVVMFSARFLKFATKADFMRIKYWR